MAAARDGPRKRIQKVRRFERPAGAIKPPASALTGPGAPPSPGTAGPGSPGGAPRWQSERTPIQTEPLVSLKVQTRWLQSDVLGYSGFIVPPGQAVANRYKTYLHQTDNRDEKGALFYGSNYQRTENTGSRTARWEACWTGIGYRSDSGSESGDVIRGPLSSPSSPRSKSTIQFKLIGTGAVKFTELTEIQRLLVLESGSYSFSEVYSPQDGSLDFNYGVAWRPRLGSADPQSETEVTTNTTNTSNSGFEKHSLRDPYPEREILSDAYALLPDFPAASGPSATAVFYSPGSYAFVFDDYDQQFLAGGTEYSDGSMGSGHIESRMAHLGRSGWGWGGIKYSEGWSTDFDAVYAQEAVYWWESNDSEAHDVLCLETFTYSDNPFTPEDESLRPPEHTLRTFRAGEGRATQPRRLSPITEQRYGSYSVRLLPVEIASANDPEKPNEVRLNDASGKQTSQDKPFVWWVNEDDDGTGQGEEQTPPGRQDFTTHKINSSRDLEDFAPLGIYLGGLQDAVAAGTFQIGLKWKNTTGNPSIIIYKAQEQTGTFTYMKDDAMADTQRTGELGQALKDKNNKEAVDAGGFILKPAFWSGLSASNPKKYLLFEGATEGKGELTLVFYDQNGTQIGEGGSMWMDIKNVKKLYERAKATPENIAAPYTLQNGPFTGPVQWQTFSLDQLFAKPWWENKECLVFVHGWNCSEDDYVSTAETMFKRMRWQGYTGKFAAFRWDTRKVDSYGSGTALDAGEFNRSENRAWVYGAALKAWATSLGNRGFTVSMAGHSMGNVVCGEALKQGLQIKNYLLMEAAVPASCYDPAAPPLDRLVLRDQQKPTPEWHTAPNGEQTLGYRGYLQSITGKLINFYNPDDYALESGKSFIGSSNIEKEVNWVANQESYKPDGPTSTILHDPDWGYSYQTNYVIGGGVIPLAQRARVDRTLGWGRYVTDSWEMKAFVSRPRTRAIGAFGHTGGPITELVNLQDDYDFGRERPDHSGQFTRRIQQGPADGKRIFDLYQVIRQKVR